MADNRHQVRSSGHRRQPSRLQRRAPASIEINRVNDWNVAIPLLSPLMTSPTSNNLTDEIESVVDEPEKKEKQPGVSGTTSFKKWQHPAAPFCYEPAPLVPFVCKAGVRVDRR